MRWDCPEDAERILAGKGVKSEAHWLR